MRILFVCMGNICRSPMAEGVFRSLVVARGFDGRIHIDSAGTSAYHVGERPDRRAQETARARGVDISSQRARRVDPSDFHDFDLILAMDSDNLRNLHRACPPDKRERVRLLLEYADADTTDVPDPYYGGDDGFNRVYDLVEAGCRGLLDAIEARLR